MLEVFKTRDRKLEQAEISEKNIWISLTNPSLEEIKEVAEQTGVFEDFLTAPLDKEELSRLEVDEDQVLIITNAAVEEEIEQKSAIGYETLPVGIIILKDTIITVSLAKVDSIEYFKRYTSKSVDTSKKTRFSLQIIYQITNRYLTALNRIDAFTEKIEDNILSKESNNEDLTSLLALEKNLLYFSTSVKGNENVVRRIMRTPNITKYEEDDDLLDDTLIELQQAGEMINIDLNIVKRIRDTYASVINNNQNAIMKTLTSLTIVLNISTIVFSFYGMNTDFGKYVDRPLMAYIILVLTSIVSVATFLWMRRKKML